MGKQWKLWQAIFLGSKITADGDCSHEIKRRLLLGRKVMTNLDSILKSRDITLATKVHLVKAMVFPVIMYGCESWTVKKAEHRRIGAFKLWCWRRLLRVPGTARRSNQSILKEISPEYSGWCWSWNSNPLATWCEELTYWKRPQCWERLKARDEKDEREWDGWMTSLTLWTRVWASSGSSCRTGKPGMLQSTGSQRVRHDWATELTEKHLCFSLSEANLIQFVKRVRLNFPEIHVHTDKQKFWKLRIWEPGSTQPHHAIISFPISIFSCG